jgi:hypothetical protein
MPLHLLGEVCFQGCKSETCLNSGKTVGSDASLWNSREVTASYQNGMGVVALIDKGSAELDQFINCYPEFELFVSSAHRISSTP